MQHLSIIAVLSAGAVLLNADALFLVSGSSVQRTGLADSNNFLSMFEHVIRNVIAWQNTQVGHQSRSVGINWGFGVDIVWVGAVLCSGWNGVLGRHGIAF